MSGRPVLYTWTSPILVKSYEKFLVACGNFIELIDFGVGCVWLTNLYTVECFSKKFCCLYCWNWTLLVPMFFSWIKENSGWRWTMRHHWEKESSTLIALIENKQIQTCFWKFWVISFFVVEKMSKIIGFYFQGWKGTGILLSFFGIQYTGVLFLYFM